jgi:16S rRNA (cytosine967-C5)-methyltransferase
LDLLKDKVSRFQGFKVSKNNYMKKLNQGPRYIAIEVLCRWEQSRLPVDQVIDKIFSNIILDDPRDRQLALSMVYGVIRWRGYLDWVIGEFSQYPLAKMKLRTLQGLRVGIFQLFFLDRVPASAAINETVQALKEMKQPKWLTGFVNGILRNVKRQLPDIATPFNKMQLPEAAMLSHPEWLIRRWKNRYGDKLAYTICLENNKEAHLCLRTNTTLTITEELLEKFENAGLHAEQGKYSPLAVRLIDYHGPVTNIPGFAEGLFQVQDEAAQLASLLLGPLEKNSYLDGCAGLGGKTSQLAQVMPAEGKLFAIEPNIERVKKLRDNLARLRLDTSVTIIEGTINSLLPDMKEKFAGVLIDAPCSGLGVIRRNPDIRWNRTPDDLLRYQDKQSAILDSGAQLLAPGGTLAYITCSTEPEENEEVIHRFLTKHSRFLVSSCRDMLPESASILVDDDGFFRTLPGQDDLDGFFAARLIKKQN